jgi:hypothetical protein
VNLFQVPKAQEVKCGVSTRSHLWITTEVSLIPISFICHDDKMGWSNGRRPRRISL